MVDINTNGKQPLYFTPHGMFMAWVNKGLLVQRPYTCKDYMTDCMYNTDSDNLEYYPSRANKEQQLPVEVNRSLLTMTIRVDNANVPYLERAIACLNKYEKYLRFKRTTCEQANMINGNPDLYGGNWYLITASKCWMKNTFMASVYISMLRMCIITHEDKWQNVAKQICSKTGNDSIQMNNTDINIFNKVLRNVKVWNITAPGVDTYKYTGFYNNRIAGHSTVGVFSFLQRLEYYKTIPQWKNFYADRMIDALKS